MKKMWFSIWGLIILVFACSENNFEDENGRGTYDYKYEETSPRLAKLSGHKKVKITNSNGNIDVVETDTATAIYVEITKIVKSSKSVEDAKTHVSGISFKAEEDKDTIHLCTNYADRESTINYSSNISVILPKISDYQISQLNGNVNIKATSNILKIVQLNGNVKADLKCMDNCAIDIVTVNGNIDCSIPENTNASLEASVFVGNVILSGLELKDAKQSATSVTGKLGSGSGAIMIKQTNGNIRLTGK